MFAIYVIFGVGIDCPFSVWQKIYLIVKGEFSHPIVVRQNYNKRIADWLFLWAMA